MEETVELAQVGLGLTVNVPIQYFKEPGSTVEIEGKAVDLDEFQAIVYAEIKRMFSLECAEYQRKTFDGYLDQIEKAVREGGENAANAEETNDDKKGQASREEVT